MTTPPTLSDTKPNAVLDAFGPAAQAKRLRDSAAYYDQLAAMAESDGDKWDAGDCRAKAAEFRRKARRHELEAMYDKPPQAHP